MRYIEFREKLKEFLVFSANDIRKVYPSFHKQRLSEWQRKGYIRKVVKGYYVFSDLDIDEPALFIIANSIYRPSYVSFEAALSFHNLIPESVYAVTSATPKTTRNFSSEIGNFIYRKIRPELMFGYMLIRRGNHSFKMAEAEKALLDHFYVNPSLKEAGDFEELRINGGVFREKISQERLKSYLRRFENASLEKRANKFLEFLKNA